MTRHLAGRSRGHRRSRFATRCSTREGHRGAWYARVAHATSCRRPRCRAVTPPRPGAFCRTRPASAPRGMKEAARVGRVQRFRIIRRPGRRSDPMSSAQFDRTIRPDPGDLPAPNGRAVVVGDRVPRDLEEPRQQSLLVRDRGHVLVHSQEYRLHQVGNISGIVDSLRHERRQPLVHLVPQPVGAGHENRSVGLRWGRSAIDATNCRRRGGGGFR
jgi:hypothetical protein